jgi:hypothetical protein
MTLSNDVGVLTVEANTRAFGGLAIHMKVGIDKHTRLVTGIA